MASELRNNSHGLAGVTNMRNFSFQIEPTAQFRQQKIAPVNCPQWTMPALPQASMSLWDLIRRALFTPAWGTGTASA